MRILSIQIPILPVAIRGGTMWTICICACEIPIRALIEIGPSCIGECCRCRCARRSGCQDTIVGHKEEWQLELIREATTCICDHISVIAPGLSNAVVHKDMNALPGLPACPSK